MACTSTHLDRENILRAHFSERVRSIWDHHSQSIVAIDVSKRGNLRKCQKRGALLRNRGKVLERSFSRRQYVRIVYHAPRLIFGASALQRVMPRASLTVWKVGN